MPQTGCGNQDYFSRIQSRTPPPRDRFAGLSFAQDSRLMTHDCTNDCSLVSLRMHAVSIESAVDLLGIIDAAVVFISKNDDGG